MTLSIPCVLMRAGTSRGPFFLRDWLPEGDEARNQALIGAIGASDPLQLDGLGGGSTLNSKVAESEKWQGVVVHAGFRSESVQDT